MVLKPHIFKSIPPPGGPHGPHFEDSAWIQAQLETICKRWSKYLKAYVEQTSSTDLFGKPELPWLNTERAIVSTLAASIIRSFPGSIVLEEARVAKPGKKLNEAANKSEDWGRCDLWVTMPKWVNIPKHPKRSGRFNFYLEAKKSSMTVSTENLHEFLHGWKGISSLFRDYMKYHPGVLTKRTSSLPERKHPHYVIGMLVMHLDKTETDLEEIDAILRDAFEPWLELRMGRTARLSIQSKYRNMKRYPTVALCVTDDAAAEKQNGFIATFTVLGATRDLMTQKETGQKAAMVP